MIKETPTQKKLRKNLTSNKRRREIIVNRVYIFSSSLNLMDKNRSVLNITLRIYDLDLIICLFRTIINYNFLVNYNCGWCVYKTSPIFRKENILKKPLQLTYINIEMILIFRHKSIWRNTIRNHYWCLFIFYFFMFIVNYFVAGKNVEPTANFPKRSKRKTSGIFF